MTGKKTNTILPGEGLLKRFRNRLTCWYRKNGRKFPWRNKSATNYQRILAEVLLQRTRAENVALFFPKFIKSYPSWKKLANASKRDLEEYLRPIGLWRQRAISINKLSMEMANRNGRFPCDREEIETLTGVGQYIANAILLFCHKEPQPLLDVNMARILERCFGSRKLADIRYDPYLQELSKTVVNCETPAVINWAILDLAALVCKVNLPTCGVCPLNDICKFAGEL